MSLWDKFIAWGSELLGLKEKPVQDPVHIQEYRAAQERSRLARARQHTLDAEAARRAYASHALSKSYESQPVSYAPRYEQPSAPPRSYSEAAQTNTYRNGSTLPSAPTRPYSTATTTNTYGPPPTQTHHHHHPVSQPRTQRNSANQYLYHYTDKRGINGIRRQMLIRSTTVDDPIHARMGPGVYLTAMGPDHTTDEILINNYHHAARHFRRKTQHYIQLKKSDVTFRKHGRRNLYVIDGYDGLDLSVTPHTFGERDL